MRFQRNFLWAVLLVFVPVPYVLTEIGWVPVVSLLTLGSVTLTVWFVEGGAEALVIGLMLLTQAAFALAFFRLAAGAMLQAVPPRRRRATVVAIIVALAATAQTPIYRTPLSSVSSTATIWGIFR
jgi:hypothetical protein